MKTTRIVIASILKPVNDVRMYKKFAKSLVADKVNEVHIVGFTSNSPTKEERIYFYPLYHFSRLSFKRLLAPLKFLKTLIKINPKIVIVSTHELLLPAILFKLLSRSALLYDVQENYYNNIKYSTAFPPALRPIIALYVRCMELIAKPFVNHFLLAEECYVDELKFTRNNNTVIENKYAGDLSHRNKGKDKESIKLLYSGTIADSYGIFDAIAMADELHKVNPRISLTIIGFASKQETLLKVKKAIHSKNYIQLIGGNQLVPHDKIIQAINEADFGFIAYRPDKSTKARIPTKIYEYLAHQLPMILFPNPLWEAICSKYKAAILVNPHSYSASQLIDEMKSTNFYSTTVDESVLWKSEEKKLLNVIEKFRIELSN